MRVELLESIKGGQTEEEKISDGSLNPFPSGPLQRAHAIQIVVFFIVPLSTCPDLPHQTGSFVAMKLKGGIN